MNIQSAFSIGVEGFQRAQQQVTQSASNIAQQTIDSANANGNAGIVQDAQTSATLLPADRTQQSVVTELVNLTVAEHQAKASAKTISAADEMIGSIIDIKV
ncbi:hypothetical protein K6Y31_07955 [Motilimonas cestriensis]|uniref:Flagellar basal-body/hook protein C-terminal domain-containing protein n=1 Tax=Motilimonas cestriensis TaxID=2742685 RepID=A0ABS8W8B8_9GAMM|nr:hypothetical protein [Motilimonas cestriensis]MCE2594748.1 hypothetical protein [Motilimonas cestriensis]